VLELCDECLRSIAGENTEPLTQRKALVGWGTVGAFRVAGAGEPGFGSALAL